MKNHTEIKTFEDACTVVGINPSLPDVSTFPEEYQKATTAEYKIKIITRAINKLDNDGEEWLPNWGDNSEYKYQPFFKMGGSSGSRFSCDDYGDWLAISYVGSRLCFKTYKACEYMCEQFTELYKEYFLV